MSTPISKRGALRFTGYNMTIRYRTDDEDGEANLVNISTNGCALENYSTELAVDEQILITIDLAEPDEQIQVQAVVVRLIENHSAALEFHRVNEDLKHRILHFCACELRRRNGDPAAAS